MKLKSRILIQTLSALLVFTLVLSAVFFLSVAGIRNTVLGSSGDLGSSAAEISAGALEEQVTGTIDRIAQDTALILDERLNKIENHTRMTADIAGSIYTNRQNWNPKLLPRLMQGDISPPGPYFFIAPGVDFVRIRDEAWLAGNIGDMLRQITVVDGGITTSTIGSESGFVIAMDAFPWPLADYDPRSAAWYSGAKLMDDLFWTNVYEDQRGRGPVISCAVPFYEQSGRQILKGVARSTVLLSDFSRIVDSAGVGKTGYLFLLNRDGIKIFSAGRVEVTLGEGGAIVGENFLNSSNQRLRSLGLSMTLGAAGQTELEMDGEPVYVAYAPIKTLGWSLGVVIPAQEISAPMWLIEEQIHRVTTEAKTGMDRHILLLASLIALLLLFSLLGIAIFSIRFTGAITGPILALNNEVHEVSGGNLEREVIIKTGDELEQLAASFNMMTVRLRMHIQEIARVTAERQRIDTELDIATRIQMSMLPHNFPPFRGRKNEFDLCAVVYPAKEVGGDFYDFFFVDDDHFAVIVADVSGKGIPAALFMAISKTLIKNHLQSSGNAKLALEIINKQLCDNNIADMFVTVWLGILEISTGRLNYINAGHNPPLIKRGNNDFSFLVSPPDLVLAGMDDTIYHPRELFLQQDDMLFLYTDGIVEAADRSGSFYGKERLREFINANAGLSLHELLLCLRTDIETFSSGAEQSDDITMLAFRVNGDSEKPLLRSVTLKADVSDLDTLVAFIGEDLDAGDCPHKIRSQIELAAEEIFVNIARYAYDNAGPENTVPDFGKVYVNCLLEKEPEKTVVTLEFQDQGRSFNPLEYNEPDIDQPLEEREPGGLGILLVKKTMDTIYYSREDESNRLVFSKSWQCKKEE